MKEIFKAFFYNSKDKFCVVYFWITIFCSLTVIMLIMRLINKGNFSDVLVLGILGFIVAWVSLYNFQKKK